MSLRHALLGLLVDEPASGYDLMKLFDTSLANVWPATQSQVYGELARLSAAGLLQVSAEGPRGRKEYALTDEGLAELRRWLVDTQPEPPRRSDTLLRVFFLGVLEPQQALDYLAGMAERAAGDHSALVALDRSIEWGDGILATNGRLALEFGLRFSAMREEWARWAVGQVSAAESDPAESVDPVKSANPATSAS